MAGGTRRENGPRGERSNLQGLVNDENAHRGLASVGAYSKLFCMSINPAKIWSLNGKKVLITASDGSVIGEGTLRVANPPPGLVQPGVDIEFDHHRLNYMIGVPASHLAVLIESHVGGVFSYRLPPGDRLWLRVREEPLA